MRIEKMGSCYLVVIDNDGKQVATVDMQNNQFFISFKNPIDIHLAGAIMELLWQFKNHPW